MLEVAFLIEGTELLQLIDAADREAVLSILLAFTAHTRRSSAAAGAMH